MNLGFNVLLVDPVHLFDLCFCQWGGIVNRKIGLQVVDFGCTGNNTADLVELQNPLQGDLCKISPVGEYLFQFIHGFQPQFVINPGKGFSFIKSLTFPVKVAVIAFAESGASVKLSR